jgi:hypothetical protein
MAIPIEVSLKIPSLTHRVPGSDERTRTNNSSVRFGKRMIVDAVPIAGGGLQLSIQSGESFDATVRRVDWSDDKNLFVISCTYGARSITEAVFAALLDDPAWTKTELP